MHNNFQLALIPARGGSKGLPGKNLRKLGGVPLIVWTIRAAIKSEIFDRIVVSTDDQEIATIAANAGAEVPFLRPAELSGDTATSDSVVAHALDQMSVEGNFALLQPTSPFRSHLHIREAAQLYLRSGAQMVVGVCASKPLEWLLVKGEDGFLRSAIVRSDRVSRRQDAVIPVVPNGSLYMTNATEFLSCRGFPVERKLGYRMSSIPSLDIDNIEDFMLAEALVARSHEGFSW